jgi:RNA polymerase sigma-70 factor (sigma-E family)
MEDRPTDRETTGEHTRSFATFYAATRDSVYRVVLLRTRSPEFAEDACQEAFSRAYADWDRISDHASPAAWVVRVALNHATSWWRRRRRELPDPPDVPAAVQSDPTQDVVVRFVWRLPERQRQVVALRVLLDLSVAETADVMGVAQGTVKATLHQALAALRTEITGQEDLQ